jgi:hypothetical protein
MVAASLGEKISQHFFALKRLGNLRRQKKPEGPADSKESSYLQLEKL